MLEINFLLKMMGVEFFQGFYIISNLTIHQFMSNYKLKQLGGNVLTSNSQWGGLNDAKIKEG